eukprot:TCONS_00001278-protein
MRNKYEHENTEPIFANNVLVEKREENPLNDLQKILNEVEEWNLKYNTRDERKLYKFTDIEQCSRVKTIDISLNESGELDIDNLQNEINKCKGGYIKIRVPSDVDLREINLNTTDSNNNNQDATMTKTKDSEKTIAEYFV